MPENHPTRVRIPQNAAAARTMRKPKPTRRIVRLFLLHPWSTTIAQSTNKIIKNDAKIFSHMADSVGNEHSHPNAEHSWTPQEIWDMVDWQCFGPLNSNGDRNFYAAGLTKSCNHEAKVQECRAFWAASPSSSRPRTPRFQCGNTGSNPVGDATEFEEVTGQALINAAGSVTLW